MNTGLRDDCPARRRRESNPRTGLCRPLPKPLGHAATAPLRHADVRPTDLSCSAERRAGPPVAVPRADDGIRTRDPHLGKVMRYQLRYVRVHTGDVSHRVPIDDSIRCARGASNRLAPAGPHLLDPRGQLVAVAVVADQLVGDRPALLVAGLDLIRSRASASDIPRPASRCSRSSPAPPRPARPRSRRPCRSRPATARRTRRPRPPGPRQRARRRADRQGGGRSR